MKIMFGYATLADPGYMLALLGRMPSHFPAVLSGYELKLQGFSQMPDIVKKVSSQNWKPSEFKSYSAHRSSNPKSQIKGIAWGIDARDEAIIDDWEFVGIWYHKEIVNITDAKGNVHKAIVYCVNGPGILVKSILNPYPVDKRKMLTLAKNNNLAARRARGEK